MFTTPECSDAETSVASTRISCGVDARRYYAVGIQHIGEALIACGYAKLDQQAKALGIHRATAWTIVKKKHKLDRLSTKTIKRILENPELPASVRAVVEKYMAERSDALARRERFRRRPHNAYRDPFKFIETKLRGQTTMLLPFDEFAIAALVDEFAIAALMVVLVVGGMRLFYGSWPWEARKTWYRTRQAVEYVEALRREKRRDPAPSALRDETTNIGHHRVVGNAIDASSDNFDRSQTVYDNWVMSPPQPPTVAEELAESVQKQPQQRDRLPLDMSP